MPNPFLDSKLNIFIATGNQDKFKRISGWLKGADVNLVGPQDLDRELSILTKVSDAEEKSAGDMQSRARLKADKAAKVIGKFPGKIIVLGQDDTAYLPWLDQEFIDLRFPHKIVLGNKVIAEEVTERLSGYKLANFYVDLVGKVATEELMRAELEAIGTAGEPGEKFMPIDWRFALAAANAAKGDGSEIIATWSVRQYILNTPLAADEPDDGYVIGKVSADNPLQKAGTINRLKLPEAAPIEALRNYLKKLD